MFDSPIPFYNDVHDGRNHCSALVAGGLPGAHAGRVGVGHEPCHLPVYSGV